MSHSENICNSPLKNLKHVNVLQSSITAMQLMEKKDLKISLLNKYVLRCFMKICIPNNIKFSTIKLLGPIKKFNREDLKYHPIKGDEGPK